MRIPEVRQQIEALAHVLEDAALKLEELAEQLNRRSSGRRAPASRRMSSGTADRVREYAARNPTASQMDIATEFRISPGRVSEVLHGKRT